MKKINILIIMLLTFSLYVSAQHALSDFTKSVTSNQVDVYTKDGNVVSGQIISLDDTLLKVSSKEKEYLIFANQVDGIITFDGSSLYTYNGKFYHTSADEIKHFSKSVVIKEDYTEISSSDFGREIGKAFKLTGALSMSFGLPAFVAGTILLAYGMNGTNHIKALPNIPNRSDYRSSNDYNLAMLDYNNKVRQNKSYINNAEIYNQCMTASYVLIPFGSALTIVGIPLYVRGRELMEFKVNYTGNGAGLALAW